MMLASCTRTTATVVLGMLLLAAATINAQEASAQPAQADSQMSSEYQQFANPGAAFIPGPFGRRSLQNLGAGYRSGIVPPPVTISYSSPYGGTYNYNYNSNPSGHQYVYEYNNGAFRYGYQNPYSTGYGTNGLTYTGPGFLFGGGLPQRAFLPGGRR